ncbi:hypothetical protein CXG81DRAFT_11191 [Caulochytrium protostelioides]|uniref:tRNA (guanine-N(7)-)-methyltransferase n=1 Tax=Caulochytrium protostelioides TaxID=1555241 RepID=A0A4P9X9P2_9FUNG|nr:hypothetical protein CXG81DRAFT_11191 [Caulochytrium protostelioides]|eukprot:RKP02077.1 hypothetical protein CXG81DRAFT_11191 [Caulochytrium protostelioides]
MATHQTPKAARVALRDNRQEGAMPRKRFFRQRAHANPFSDHQLEYPSEPTAEFWKPFYPKWPADAATQVPRFADVGCGYGGLLVSLAPLFPETLMLGLEIRDKVEEYVKQRIDGLREQGCEKGLAPTSAGSYQNISVLRSNAMKFLPHFFAKGQMEKLFFLFPDPHFKKKKHKARIITPQLLAEYAFLLKEGGLLYIATDVRALFDWMVTHIDKHPLFQRLDQAAIDADPCVRCVLEETEEGKKVARNAGDKFMLVYRRLPTAEVAAAMPDWCGFSAKLDIE